VACGPQTSDSAPPRQADVVQTFPTLLGERLLNSSGGAERSTPYVARWVGDVCRLSKVSDKATVFSEGLAA